ncbi:MAG: hypothetical protein GY943_15500 [Chloroflexi bacterium]|nr:hypothetical protein [Chloroflexota bacterium]
MPKQPPLICGRTFNHFALSIRSVANGTGELSGMRRIARFEEPTAPPDTSPCETPLEAETWQVFIFEP